MDVDVVMDLSEEGCGPGTSSWSSGMFECPICLEEVRGSSEEEMSASFREHLLTTHKDEPFVTQLMEKVGKQ